MLSCYLGLLFVDGFVYVLFCENRFYDNLWWGKNQKHADLDHSSVRILSLSFTSKRFYNLTRVCLGKMLRGFCMDRSDCWRKYVGCVWSWSAADTHLGGDLMNCIITLRTILDFFYRKPCPSPWLLNDGHPVLCQAKSSIRVSHAQEEKTSPSIRQKERGR